MSAWHLRLLGTAQLHGATGKVLVERKPAALLAYLAFEGPTSRSKLAYLFWPDSLEATARVNLRQLLRRVRLLREQPLTKGEDPLGLADDLQVDVVHLQLLAFSGDYAAPLTTGGELLEHYTYDDAPPFAEWLTAARDHLGSLRRRMLTARLDQLEARGAFLEARAHAEQLLQLDPLSEEAYRRLMRLHYLSGDRPAALESYHRLQKVLRTQFGVTPLPETVQLAREIAREQLPSLPAARSKPLPLSVLRPPVLVGREEAWSWMEEAWEAGQFIIISGEPGIGKTRLALDFAASKGRSLYLEGRPGDGVVPLSTTARNVRRILAHLDVELEPWMLRALTPLLPELATGETALNDVAGQPTLPLPEAVRQLLQVSSRSFSAFIFDDVQFADPTSIEAGFYIVSSSFPFGRPEGISHWLCCFRQGDLNPHTAAIFEHLVAAGQAAHIELGPLSEPSVEQMLAGLELPGTHALSSQLTHLAGGNPLYILETVRHLIETGRLEEGLPGGMLPPGRAGSIIRRRLERLSPSALRVAQAAAILQSDFEPALIGELLNLDALTLLEPWEELEKAQVLEPKRFCHDLVYEAVHQDISPSVSSLLHRRAAEVLAARQINPLRVAEHWLAAGNDLAAAPYLTRAAEAARTISLWAEARDLYRRAAAIYVAHGRSEDLALTLLRLHQLPTYSSSTAT